MSEEQRQTGRRKLTNRLTWNNREALNMGNSFKLFAIRGIDIRIHITFPLILLWAAWQFGQQGGTEGAVFGVVIISLLFVLVTLHELGHSFAALHYGVPVRQIVLLPIGGLAQLEQMPEKPIQELVVALAGPAVNVVLALILGVIVFAAGIPIINPLSDFSLSLSNILWYLLFYNVMLALFNMLPAFPMDGGRVLRAFLAMFLNYEFATAVAVNVGRGVAAFLALSVILPMVGISVPFFRGSVFTLVIALFIFTAGTQELAMVRWRGRVRHSGYGYSVQEVYSPGVRSLGPQDNLRHALKQQLAGWQSDFPVADGGHYIGFVSEDGLLKAANLFGPDALVYAAMSPDLRPLSPQADLLDAQQQMARFEVRALPVVEYGRLLGMITYRQIQEFVKMRAAMLSGNDTPRIVGA